MTSIRIYGFSDAVQMLETKQAKVHNVSYGSLASKYPLGNKV
jgi:hypothetical protein